MDIDKDKELKTIFWSILLAATLTAIIFSFILDDAKFCFAFWWGSVGGSLLFLNESLKRLSP